MENLYTIGFTKKSAETFFSLLQQNNINRLIDVRLNNVSQLSGFAKKNDLKYFLQELCGISYLHIPDLAPTNDILRSYKSGDISWDIYKNSFTELLSERYSVKDIDLDIFKNSCLLCSEHIADFCHRRLVAEHIVKLAKFEINIKHLS